MREEYHEALRRGRDAVKRAEKAGVDPHLPVLDERINPSMIKGEVSLGLMDLPLSMITGNKESARSNAFANNFMPLLEDGSEFALKWGNLYDSVQTEGVRESIKVYEYMNRYYVQEGNKRVSVSFFCGNESILADVTRILPVESDTREYRAYQEYLRFYQATKLHMILLTEQGEYEKLAELVGCSLDEEWSEDLRRDLKTAYYRFRRQYRNSFDVKDEFDIGNSFLIYLMLFPFKTIFEESDDQIAKNIKLSAAELFVKTDYDRVAFLSSAPIGEDTSSGILKLFTGKRGYTASHPLKVGFIYNGDIENSRWIDSHEAGRLYVEEMTGERVQTKSYTVSDTDTGCSPVIERALSDHCEVIFTVSEDLLVDTISMAMLHKDVKFLNCSTGHISPTVRCYHGRLYEADFLMGILAADTLLRNSSGEDRRIGYFYLPDDPMRIINLNAFAIGVSMIDPECRILLNDGTDEKADDCIHRWHEQGVGVYANIGYTTETGSSLRPGVFSITGEKEKYIGTSYYNWGKFYVQIVQAVLSGAWDINDLLKGKQAANYWFGLTTGVVDVRTPDISYQTKKMLSFFKNSIVNGGYDPFDGEIRSNKGIVQQNTSGRGLGIPLELDKMSAGNLFHMDWYNDNIETD